ncbi:type I-E CRISPR-associated protein Cse2/CasB [Actibacterium sp. D379-3]
MPDEIDEMARRALSIAAALAAADPGEKAQARRMGPEGAPVFWRQVTRLGIPQWQEAGWLRFTRLIALLTPASREASIHDGVQHLGAALALAGLSEHRFARLLAARGAAREDALERAIRMLARKSAGLNVPDLARAVFRPDDTGPLARTYYKELDHSQTEEPNHD